MEILFYFLLAVALANLLLVLAAATVLVVTLYKIYKKYYG